MCLFKSQVISLTMHNRCACCVSHRPAVMERASGTVPSLRDSSWSSGWKESSSTSPLWTSRGEAQYSQIQTQTDIFPIRTVMIPNRIKCSWRRAKGFFFRILSFCKTLFRCLQIIQLNHIEIVYTLGSYLIPLRSLIFD